MIDASRLSAFRKELILGKFAQADALQKLSFAAMMSKFERMELPQTAPAPVIALPSAHYPNAQARRALLRLLTGRDGNVSDSMAAAVPPMLQRHGLALHPFDFAKLEDFVARNAEHLSSEARDWLRVIRPERKETEDGYLDGPITEEHLGQASRAQRINFLRELRVRDAARARALIETMMPQEAAEMRLRLLKVLSDRPTADDQPFLEGLLKDRAPTVKDLALTLLSRIPGTETFARQVARLKEDLQIKTEGLFRRKKAFVYRGPEPKTGKSRFDDLMNGLGLTEIATALGESEASLISIAMQSNKLHDLQMLLVRKAIDARRYDLVPDDTDHIYSHDGQLMTILIRDDFAERTDEDRANILMRCFTPEKWKQLPQGLTYNANFIPPTLPEALARALLAHPGWETLAEHARKATYEAVAHLIPAPLSATFTQMAEVHAPRAALYHRFIQSIAR